MSKKGLITHKQRQDKFFTIMLVPYSSTKVKKIKIPHIALYSAAAFVAVLALTSFIYSNRSAYFKSTLSDVQKNLESTSILNDVLTEEAETLNSLLDEEKAKSQETIKQQREDYEDSLDYYDDKLKELDLKIEELEKAKQEIFDKLSSIKLPKSLAESLIYAEASIPAFQAEYVSAVNLDKMSLIDKKITDMSEKLETETTAFWQLASNIDIIKPYLDSVPTNWPVRGTVTSEVGTRLNPFTGKNAETHSGMDIAVSSGTTVKAPGGGTVTFAGYNGNYGYLVILDHGFGITTYYGHNSKLLVSVGDTVARGDALARSGSTGRSTGPHVHYEVRLNGVIQNPRNYLKEN